MKKGFTLIELLVVVAIIGLLASIVVVSLGGARKGGRDAKRQADLKQIQTALEIYYDSQLPEKYPVWGGTCAAITGILSEAPKDPINSGTNVYKCWSDADSYCLSAQLESDSKYIHVTQAGNKTAQSGACLAA